MFLDGEEGSTSLEGYVTVALGDDRAVTSISQDDPDLSLALVSRDGVLATAGPQPDARVLRAVARQAADGGASVRRKAGTRFLAARGFPASSRRKAGSSGL